MEGQTALILVDFRVETTLRTIKFNEERNTFLSLIFICLSICFSFHIRPPIHHIKNILYSFEAVINFFFKVHIFGGYGSGDYRFRSDILKKSIFS